jgi:hypothetical protein
MMNNEVPVQPSDDRWAIQEIILRYARALDRLDQAMLDSCFHPDSVHEHGAYKGPTSEFSSLRLEHYIHSSERSTI